MVKKECNFNLIILLSLLFIILLASLSIGSINLTSKNENEITGLNIFKDLIDQLNLNEVLGFFNKYLFSDVGKKLGLNLEPFGFYHLNIIKEGDDSSIISSEDGKINCGKVCSAYYTKNSKVTLLYSNSQSSSFERWDGPCESYSLRCKPKLGYSQIASVNLCKDYIISCDLIITKNTQVIAVFNLGTSGSGSQQPVTQIPLTPPSITVLNAPSDFEVIYVSPTQLNLRWKDNSDNEKGFVIERRILDPVATTFQEIARVNANVKQYEDKNLIPDTVYEYRVMAYSDGVYSPYTDSFSEITCYDQDSC